MILSHAKLDKKKSVDDRGWKIDNKQGQEMEKNTKRETQKFKRKCKQARVEYILENSAEIQRMSNTNTKEYNKHEDKQANKHDLYNQMKDH